jgi:hypothetical protein
VTHYVIQWSMAPGYAEFVGMPEGSHAREVVVADSITEAISKAESPSEDGVVPDLQAMHVSAVWTVGDSPVWDSDARLLEAYFDGSDDADPDRLIYDPERGEWDHVGPKPNGTGDMIQPLTVLVWGYDPRYDHTDESARAPRL